METNPVHDRIWNDDASGITVADADPIAHGREMLAVLHEQGVEAYLNEMERIRVLDDEVHRLVLAEMLIATANDMGEDPLEFIERLCSEIRERRRT